MDTELGFYAATFRYGHGQLFVGGGAFFSLFASFPFISACFFSGNFRFTHEQQKAGGYQRRNLDVRVCGRSHRQGCIDALSSNMARKLRRQGSYYGLTKQYRLVPPLAPRQ